MISLTKQFVTNKQKLTVTNTLAVNKGKGGEWKEVEKSKKGRMYCEQKTT